VQPERRLPIRRLLVRVVLLWLIESGALLLVAAVLPGVHVESAAAALLTVAAIGLVNAVAWPLLARVALPFTVLTFGLGALVLNGGVVLLADALVPGFELRGLGDAVLTALGLAAVNAAVSGLLSIDDDDSYYRRVVLRGARRLAGDTRTEVPGVFMLEIDGLSERTLRRAMGEGHMPTLARWVEEGSHRIVSWECDLSSQTAASQAGLLMGSNEDVPAFRWYEKENGRLRVSSSRADCKEVERRLSTGKGLLADGGVSVGNVFSGDAPRSLFTFSTAALRRRVPPAFLAFFSDPYSMTRTVALIAYDVVLEKRAAWSQRLRNELPRIKRGGKYPLIRAGTTVMLRDLSLATLMGHMFAGTPLAYATFFGYDEVAHHSGIERADAFAVLRRLDRQFGRLERAASLAPRPYRFVVLSDHGQSQGATFLQRYGLTLEELVERHLGDGRAVGSLDASQEALAGIGAALTDVSEGEGTMTARLARRAEDEADAPRPVEEAESGAVVLASGNLGLIYLLDRPARMTLEEIEELHPELLPALVQHPGISFLRVRSATRGPLALGASGTRRLEDGSVEGEDPLASFGPDAGAHLLRADAFTHAPDLLAMSMYDPQTEEVAAFEELVGSHGGLGGPQGHPFALVPAEWSAVGEPIVGAAAVHAALKNWIYETQRPAGAALPR
jgi:uncharacterized membrane protein YvlD (DUF360 family)